MNDWFEMRELENFRGYDERPKPLLIRHEVVPRQEMEQNLLIMKINGT